jgi:hypothetical protein
VEMSEQRAKHTNARSAGCRRVRYASARNSIEAGLGETGRRR